MLKLLRINNIALIAVARAGAGRRADAPHGRDRGRQVDPDRRPGAAPGRAGLGRAHPDGRGAGRRSRRVFEVARRAAAPRGATGCRVGRRRGRRPARDPGQREGPGDGQRRPRAGGPSCATLAPRLAVDPRPARAPGAARPRDPPRALDHYAGARRRPRPLAESFRGLREAEAALERLRRDRREAERRREMLEFQAGEIEKAGPRGGRGGGAPPREGACRPTRAAWRRCRGEAYGCSTRTRARCSRASARSTGGSRSWPRSTPRFAPLPRGPGGGRRARSRTWPCSCATTSEGLQVSPGRLDEIESRLALIERLKRKYGATVEEVLAFGAALPRASWTTLGIAGGAGAGPRGASASGWRRATWRRARGSLEAAPGRGARPREAGAGRAGAAGHGEDALRGALRPRADRGRRGGPGGVDGARASSGPSSCSRPTPARSCARWRASPPGASCPASCCPQVRRPVRRAGADARLRRGGRGHRRARGRGGGPQAQGRSPRGTRSSASRTSRRSPPWPTSTSRSASRSSGGGPSPRSRPLAEDERVEEVARMLGGETVTDDRAASTPARWSSKACSR